MARLTAKAPSAGLRKDVKPGENDALAAQNEPKKRKNDEEPMLKQLNAALNQ